ncbi:MAG: Subtilisin [Acidobacteria bacterium]|nr:Subtilisin [Acidobacteriota bacterium]
MNIPKSLYFMLFLCLACPFVAMADSYYLPISGSVGNFRSDVRVYNPSGAESHVTYYFLPVNSSSNGTAFLSGKSATIAPKSLAAYDDMVSTFLGTTGIGAIYIDADTTLVITTRIYAQTTSGTLGQGYRAERLGTLMTNGVLQQLRSDAAFRTNIGVANLQNAVATVTWTLFDKNGHKVSEKATTFAPYQILGPTSIASGFFFDAGSADLSDATVVFHSDSPVGVYASVIDNSTTDPTYFSAASTDF